MEVTEVRIQLRESPNKKLKAYATVTFDNQFVVRFIKVIQGANGLFIAMPARRQRIFCPKCGRKVDIRARFCNWCGIQLPPPPKDFLQRQQEHQDIAHPINQNFRDYLQKKVLEAYEEEIKKVEGKKKEEKKDTTQNIQENALNSELDLPNLDI